MAQKIEIKGNTFYITDTVTGKEWKLPAKDVRYEDNKDNSVTFYDIARRKSDINITFSDLVDSTDTAFTDFQSLTDWNDTNLGKSNASDGVTTFKKAIGYLYSQDVDNWFSADSSKGFADSLHKTSYGLNADTSPSYTVPTLLEFSASAKIKHISISGLGYTTPIYTFKFIKYNRNTLTDLQDVAVLSVEALHNVYDRYAHTNIDVDVNNGDVVALIWKCDTVSKSFKDVQITIKYEEIN